MKHLQLKQLIKEEIRSNERLDLIRNVIISLMNRNYGRNNAEIKSKLEKTFGEKIGNTSNSLFYFINRLIDYYQPSYNEKQSKGIGLPALHHYVANSIGTEVGVVDLLKSEFSENIDSHEEMGDEHRKLKKQFELAKQFAEKKRKIWKATKTNSTRFDYQNALGIVRQLEKKLWNY